MAGFESDPAFRRLFLGSRKVRFGAQRLPEGPLEVEARHHAGERGLVAFDCRVREPSGDAPRVEGRVNVYIVDRWEDLMEQPVHGA